MKNYTPIKVEKILKKIRETRKLKGLSHENMAHELDISPSAYNKLERSETTLSLERLLKIIEILEISLYDIFEIESESILKQNLKEFSFRNADNIHKEKSDKIEHLYECRIKDKDFMIEQLQKVIDKLTK
jgi:transcriptional regulator with XRE-family HTH domain